MKIVPLISSGTAGPLGVLHLPRLWLKASLEARGALADGYPGCGHSYDQLCEKHGERALPRLMERHLTSKITRLLSGVATRSRYGRNLLKFSLKHLVWDVAPPETFAIRA